MQAERGQRIAHAMQRLAVIGFLRQHPFDRAGRFLWPIQPQQRARAIEHGIEMIAVDGQRLLVALERVGMAVEREQHVTAHEQRGHMARLRGQRRLAVGERGIMPPLPRQQRGTVAARVCVMR